VTSLSVPVKLAVLWCDTSVLYSVDIDQWALWVARGVTCAVTSSKRYHNRKGITDLLLS
jgi:hypothetical protein